MSNVAVGSLFGFRYPLCYNAKILFIFTRHSSAPLTVEQIPLGSPKICRYKTWRIYDLPLD